MFSDQVVATAILDYIVHHTRADRPFSQKNSPQGSDAADVRTMKLGEAKAIYRKQYWDAERCDERPAGIDYSVLDYVINSGIGA